MKPRLWTAILVVSGLSFIAGCATTQELTSSVKSKVVSITSAVDPALVNQVPVEKREGFAKAEYDLKEATEKGKLADLKSELAGAQKRYAGHEVDMAESFRKEAELDYDLVKIEAVLNAGLGKREELLKTKTGLQQKKLGMQSNRIGIKADLESLKGKINEMTGQIAKMEESIKAMTPDAPKGAPEPAKEAK